MSGKEQHKTKFNFLAWAMYVLFPMLGGSLLISGGITYQSQKFELVRQVLDKDYLEFNSVLQEYRQVENDYFSLKVAQYLLESKMSEYLELALKDPNQIHGLAIHLDALSTSHQRCLQEVNQLKDKRKELGIKFRSYTAQISLVLNLDKKLLPIQKKEPSAELKEKTKSADEAAVEVQAKMGDILLLMQRLSMAEDPTSIQNLIDSIQPQKCLEAVKKRLEETQIKFKEENEEINEIDSVIRKEIELRTNMSFFRAVWRALVGN